MKTSPGDTEQAAGRRKLGGCGYGSRGRGRATEEGLGKGVMRPTPAQLCCLANLAALHGLQGDFLLHPPDLLLFYK